MDANKDSVDGKISSLKKDSLASLKQMEDRITMMRDELKQNIEASDARVLEQGKNLDELRKRMEEDLDRVKIHAYGNSNELRH